MQRIVWLALVALLLVDAALLLQRRELEASIGSLRSEAISTSTRAKYTAEEDSLLASTSVVPAAFLFLQAGQANDDSVQILLVGSVDDCTSSIEDEVSKLNELALKKPGRIAAIRGFFVDEGRGEMARRFIGNLSPRPIFSMLVKNVLLQLPRASTPIVLVVQSRDGKVIDAHKPIPEDLIRRDAFYARLTAYLGQR